MRRDADDDRVEHRRYDRYVVHRTVPGFDRVAYAVRALRLLRPAGLSVAVRSTHRDLRIECGKHWGGAPDDRWAIVAVPPDATREAIALALLDLAGRSAEPFALETLLALDFVRPPDD